jgi:hypothetical protein
MEAYHNSATADTDRARTADCDASLTHLLDSLASAQSSALVLALSPDCRSKYRTWTDGTALEVARVVWGRRCKSPIVKHCYNSAVVDRTLSDLSVIC